MRNASTKSKQNRPNIQINSLFFKNDKIWRFANQLMSFPLNFPHFIIPIDKHPVRLGGHAQKRLCFSKLIQWPVKFLNSLLNLKHRALDNLRADQRMNEMLVYNLNRGKKQKVGKELIIDFVELSTSDSNLREKAPIKERAFSKKWKKVERESGAKRECKQTLSDLLCAGQSEVEANPKRYANFLGILPTWPPYLIGPKKAGLLVVNLDNRQKMN